MKTISQYREEIKSLKKAAGDISAKATAENRDPLPAEISLKNEIMDKMEELEGIVTSMEREERISARLEKPEDVLTKPGPQKVKSEDRPQDRFASLGHQMAAVMKAGQPGGHADPRLFRAAEGSGLSESVPSDGGLN